MKPRCWPTCIAQVVRARLPENVGKICTVLAADPVTGEWIVQFPAPIRWRVLFDDAYGRPCLIDVWSDVGPAPDSHLIPLTPPPDALADCDAIPEALEA